MTRRSLFGMVVALFVRPKKAVPLSRPCKPINHLAEYVARVNPWMDALAQMPVYPMPNGRYDLIITTEMTREEFRAFYPDTPLPSDEPIKVKRFASAYHAPPSDEVMQLLGIKRPV